jgi:predicted Zn-dependent peptidase
MRESRRERNRRPVAVQFEELTATAYQRLAIRLRIAGLQADVHRISDESFIKLTHYSAPAFWF